MSHSTSAWNEARQSSLSFTISWSLLKFMSIELVMPPNHLILCGPLLLLPSIGFFSNESALCIRWPRHWSFSFSISPSNEYSRVISFRTDQFDLLEVQDSQESSPTPQFSSINSLAFRLLYGQLSYPYMTTGKIIALTIWTFVSKVMFLY